MIINVHSDASYLSSRYACIRSAGNFFLVWTPHDNHPIRLNGAIFTLCTIPNFSAASAAESELGELFLNAKEEKTMRLTSQDIVHHQPPTPINCNNATSAGIANGTVKRQQSRSMEMRYVSICDLVKND